MRNNSKIDHNLVRHRSRTLIQQRLSRICIQVIALFPSQYSKSNCHGRLNIRVSERSHFCGIRMPNQSFICSLVLIRHLHSRTVRVPLFIVYNSCFVSVYMCKSAESTTFVREYFFRISHVLTRTGTQ